MRRALFLLWFCLWPLFLGVWLPYLTLPGNLKLMNVLWGLVDGLGLWFVDKTVGLNIQSPFVALGAFVWPVVVSSGMLILGRSLNRVQHRKLRSAVVAALIASSLLVVSLRRATHPPLSRLPMYYRLSFVVW
jgi:hypothetical protein